LINGGCSDDGFFYFRAWLISRGQKVYDAALQNPDSLAKVADPTTMHTSSRSCGTWPGKSNAEVAGKELTGKFRWAQRPKGKRWDFDDDEAVAEHLRSWRRFIFLESAETTDVFAAPSPCFCCCR